MQIYRAEDGAASIELDHGEVLDLLGAVAMSLAAYGILQNFMTPTQKAMATPSLLFLARLGATLSEGEDFSAVESHEGDPELQHAPPDPPRPPSGT